MKSLPAGITAIVFGLLMFVPVIALGAAIDWPASLGEPATTLIPLIAEQAGAVQLGYAVYLVYSVLFLPAIALLARLAGDSWIVRLAITAAAVSALARAIGIVRWLAVLPTVTDPELFDAINVYGGAIGELLGVSLFGAAAIALVSVALRTVVSRWLTIFGLVAAAGLLLPWIEVFGVDLGAVISVSVAVVQLWFLAIGVVLVLKSRAAR